MTREYDRSGVTLAELLIAMVIGLLVVGLAAASTARYQQSQAALAAAGDLSSRLRDAANILTSDLRGISPFGDTILVASDTAIEFQSVVGASVLCAIPRLDRVSLPPDTLSSGRLLSAYVASPDTGDMVVIHHTPPDDTPPIWSRARIVALSSQPAATSCPASMGLLSASDLAGAGKGYELTLDRPVPLDAHRGSPVRIVRRVRYSVYRGGDGKWYLGYRRCAGACSAIQPVSGPYESRQGSPLIFRFFSRNGSQLVGSGSSTDVSRVEIVARGSSLREVVLPGTRRSALSDSVLAVVALRNAR